METKCVWKPLKNGMMITSCGDMVEPNLDKKCCEKCGGQIFLETEVPEKLAEEAKERMYILNEKWNDVRSLFEGLSPQEAMGLNMYLLNILEQLSEDIQIDTKNLK